jgi:hypothetical protein
MAREAYVESMVVVVDDRAVAGLEHNPAVVAAFDRMATEAVLTMKRLTPVSPVGPLHRSGNLRSSVHAFREHLAGQRTWVIGPTADYGRFVNDDTVPHLIVSHGPWPLRNRETGQVFGRRVMHPGTRGQRFVERTAATFEGRRVEL